MNASAGLERTGEYLRDLKNQYQSRRDIVCESLLQAGMRPIIPEGAYYVLADVGDFGYADARGAAFALLEQTGVAAIPGSAFYRDAVGESLLRFCFAKDEATLREAGQRLQRFRPKSSS